MKRKSFAHHCFTFMLLSVFALSNFISPVYAQKTILNLPAPGTFVTTSQPYIPTLIKGMTMNPQNPFAFDFIVDTGDSNVTGEALKAESEKLIKYFLAAVTVPEQELWVNLSPYEQDLIIPDGFGTTDMGRDLLAQDYMLKQLSASMIYPNDDVGQTFWKKIYERARDLYGRADIPINTFNKIWIVPERAVVYEKGNSAFVIDSYMKVMLEEDYVALQENLGVEEYGLNSLKINEAEVLTEEATEVIKEVLIPEIEHEINYGKNFANLRQIYSAMVLATWYKMNLKETLLNQVYANQNKTAGINLADPLMNQQIYDQYVAAFNKGVFEFIKEDYEVPDKQVLARKYFSGGFDGIKFSALINRIDGDAAMLTADQQTALLQALPVDKEGRYHVQWETQVISDGTDFQPVTDQALLTVADRQVLGEYARYSARRLLDPKQEIEISVGQPGVDAGLDFMYSNLVDTDGLSAGYVAPVDLRKIWANNMSSSRGIQDVNLVMVDAVANQYFQDYWDAYIQKKASQPGLSADEQTVRQKLAQKPAAKIVTLQGDEKVVFINPILTEAEAQEMLQGVQVVVGNALVAQLGNVEVNVEGMTPNNQEKFLQIVREQATLHDNNMTGLRTPADGVFLAYNRRGLDLETSADFTIAQINKALADSGLGAVNVSRVSDKPAERIFSPEIAIGLADMSLPGVTLPENFTRQDMNTLYGDLYSRGEALADYASANDVGFLGTMGILANSSVAEDFQENLDEILAGQKDTLPTLQPKQKTEISEPLDVASRQLQFRIYSDQVHDKFQALKRDVFSPVLQKTVDSGSAFYYVEYNPRYFLSDDGPTMNIINEEIDKKVAAGVDAVKASQDVYAKYRMDADRGATFKARNVLGHLGADKSIRDLVNTHNEVMEKNGLKDLGFTFIQTPDTISVLIPKKLLGRELSPQEVTDLVDEVSREVLQKPTFVSDVDKVVVDTKVIDSDEVASVEELKKDMGLFYTTLNLVKAVDQDSTNVKMATTDAGNNILDYEKGQDENLKLDAADKRTVQRKEGTDILYEQFREQLDLEAQRLDAAAIFRESTFENGFVFRSSYDATDKLTTHSLLWQDQKAPLSFTEWGNTTDDLLQDILLRNGIQDLPFDIQTLRLQTIETRTADNKQYKAEIDLQDYQRDPKFFSRPVFLSRLTFDQAQLAQTKYARTDKYGGINLNPAMLALEVRRDENGVPLPMDQQPQDINLKVDGFVPVILDISPLESLPIQIGAGAIN